MIPPSRRCAARPDALTGGDHVIERGRTTPELWGRLECTCDEVDGFAHRNLEHTALRQPRGHGRRECAAGAMRFTALDSWMTPDVLVASVPEQIDHLVTLEVTTLDQSSPRAELDQGARRAAEVVRGFDLVPEQQLGLMGVGCDKRGEREQPGAHSIDGFFGEQAIAARRDHDGVEYKGAETMRVDRLSHRFDELARGEHAGLDRGRRQIVDHDFDLLLHEVDGHGMHAVDAGGVLGGNRGDDRGAEDAERLKGLEIGLNACTSARVRPGDGEGNGGRGRVGHSHIGVKGMRVSTRRSAAIVRKAGGGRHPAPWRWVPGESSCQS